MSYSLKSLCLVNEERHCRCGQIYHVPSNLALVLVSKGKQVYCQPPTNVFEFDLPRETRTFTVPIRACRECFEVSSVEQPLLFGSREPEKYDLFNIELEEFANKKLSAQKLIKASLAKEIQARLNNLGGKDKNLELVTIGKSTVHVTKAKAAKKGKKEIPSVEEFF